MSSHQVQSVVLPAILASSTVFSFLTLPFFIYRSHSTAGALLINPKLQMILESQNRDLTIRYIGGAMVASVATGITTVELWRRQKARQTALWAKQARQDLSSAEQPAPSLHHPDEWIDLEQSSDWDSIDQLFEGFEGMASSESEQPFTALTTDQLTEIAAEHSDLSLANQGALLATSTSDPACPGQVTEWSGEYTTCRIWVNALHRRLFAIQVGEQYYSFFRLLPTHEAALETAHLLSDKQHHVMVTPVEQQYAVWVWQSEVEVEVVTQ